MMGKSYLQEKSMQATGSDGSDIREIEYFHNLNVQSIPTQMRMLDTTKELLEKMHFCSRYTSQIHTSEKFGQDPTDLELQE